MRFSLLLLAGVALVLVATGDADAKEAEWNYMAGDIVSVVAISADGEYIAAGSYVGGKVYLFDKDNSTPLWSYAIGGAVRSVAISADGEYIAAGSFVGKVYLFGKDSSTPLWNYTAGSYVYSVDISADGEYVVAGTIDGKVYLFDKDNSTPLWNYTTEGDMQYPSVDISADGEYVVAGINDGKVYLFDKNSNTPLWNWDLGHEVNMVDISADGEYIAVSGRDSDEHRVYLFDKDEEFSRWYFVTGDEVRSIAISADGEYITAASDDGRVYLYNNDDGNGELGWIYHTEASTVESVAISADGEYIAAGSWNDLGGGDKVYFFGKDSSTPLWSYATEGAVRSVAISSDGEYIAAGSGDHNVYLFDKGSGMLFWSYETENSAVSVFISADGEYIAAGSSDGKVYFSDNSYGGTPLWPGRPGRWNHATAGPHPSVGSVAISADGNYIVVGGYGDGKVYLFGKDSSTPLWSYEIEDIDRNRHVNTVAISADGEYIVAGAYDDKVYLFGKDSSTPLWSYATGGAVTVAAISADGEYIAAGSIDNRVYLFGKDSSTPLWNYTAGSYMYSVDISADGEYIVAGSYDDKVYLFDKEDSSPQWNYSTGGDVSAVSISADGEYVVAGTIDGKVYLFDKDNSTPLWNYTTEGDMQYPSVDISADGEYVVAGINDGKVYLFDKDNSTPLWSYTADSNILDVAISADGKYIVAGSSKRVSIIDRNILTTATIDAITPSPAKFNAKVTFNGSWSGSADTAVAYEWTSDIDGFLSDEKDFSVIGFVLTVGKHNITFRAQDGSWSVWSTASLEIYPNEEVRNSTDLRISPDNIQLEVNGVIGNASQVKEGDTVVVLVEVENTGTADAEEVRVEIFYYFKDVDLTQSVIDDLIIYGFVFDEVKNTYIYTLYDDETIIKSGNKKSIASDDWIIENGEWYVEARVDYYGGGDVDLDTNGKILETDESNNDARYPEVLRVKPDLHILTMRIDDKYAGYPPAQVPNIDDTVTFTVTVTNAGTADVKGARLYITAYTSAVPLYSSGDNAILVERSSDAVKTNYDDHKKFDVDAGETIDVFFHWKAREGIWNNFRAVVNPVCEDYNIALFTCESEGDGFAAKTDRMFDELGVPEGTARYTDNEYPTTITSFEQSGAIVIFEVLPYVNNEGNAGDGNDGGGSCPYGGCGVNNDGVGIPPLSVILTIFAGVSVANIAVAVIALRLRPE